MKQLKRLLLLITAICFTASVHAQKTKVKTKTKQQVARSSYQCPMKCEEEKTYNKPGKCAVCNMNLRKIEPVQASYACPMKCEGEKTYVKAGKCPVCNMNLKPVQVTDKKKDDHTGHAHQ